MGAIPVGLIVSKLFRGVDIREHGSGNIGFANSLRVLGVVPGVIVLLGDVAKGVIPVLFISRLGAIQTNARCPKGFKSLRELTYLHRPSAIQGQIERR